MQINLIIAEWNANGILNHVNEIEIFLKNNFIDILLVSETHLTSKSHFRIRGFDLITANQPNDRAHAGAAIVIKSTIKYEILEPITELYMQAAGVKIVCNNCSVSIYSVYSPPRYSIKCVQYENFFNKLGNRFLVGGDYNAKHTWWGSRLSNPKGKELFKCISKNNYSSLSTGAPTYWPADISKIPDLLDFFVYKGIPATSLDIVSSDDLSSDHSPIIVNFSTVCKERYKAPHLIATNTDLNYFQQFIETELDLNLSLKTGYEIDLAIENFSKLIHEAAFVSTPQVNNHISSFQLSFEIRQLIALKRRLRKIWQRTRLHLDKTNFNRAANYLKRRLKDLKNESISRYLGKLHPDNKNEHNLWKATKYLKHAQRRNVPIKDSNGDWCRSDASKAGAFKSHLENIFTPFSFCTTQEDAEVNNFLDVACQMSKPIKPFRNGEIEVEISKLNPKKSPGYDNIDAKVLKNLPKKAIIFLTVVFNAALRLSYIPVQWKHAKIIMIQKPNKPENSIESYRPISLLPVLSKIFERLFLKRLMPILESQQVIPDHQFGFRNKHGTPEQCHRIVKSIRDSLENKQYCSSVFLDVKQAFDRVWHNGLLFKLKHLLQAPFYLLLKSYLTDRSFCVNINEENSEIGDIKAGVPQGSVLGPTLYTIFTSDMPTNTDVVIATYADDTAILAVNESASIASSNIQTHLDLVNNWFKKWNIKVNEDKSTHVTFTLKNGDCPSVKLNEVVIPKSNEVKYLGLTIDRRLTWKTHIKMKRKQLNTKTSKMYWLLGPKSKLSINNKLLLYKTILKPIWTYGIQLWGTASYSNIDIIQKYQSKTLRLIIGAPWYVRNTTIHNDLEVAYVRDEIKKYSTNYLKRLSDHQNILAITLLNDDDEVRRLKRLHILDLPFSS